MSQYQIWIKKVGSAWKLYTDSNCANEVTSEKFESPYNELTSYQFTVAQRDFSFYADEPIKWKDSSNVPHLSATPGLTHKGTVCSFKDDNRYSHKEDKNCGFDLQLVDNNHPTSPIPIYAVLDVDPTILEKGDPNPGGGSRDHVPAHSGTR